MPEVIPALMPKTLKDIEAQVRRIKGLVKTVQLDVMDGLFVPPKSWPYTFGGEREFGRLIAGDIGFPLWKEMDYEADLMVQNPEKVLSRWIDAGVKRVIVHVESTQKLNDIVKQYGSETPSKASHESMSLPVVELGIALDIKTPNEHIYKHVPHVDFVQFMGISQIGYQGNPFDERVLQKIKDLRSRFKDVTISVDGGVSLETASQLVDAGASRLVSGSAIWKSESTAQAIECLRKIH